MGLVVCPKHGNGFMFVCQHVADAVLSGLPRPGIQHLAYTAADPDFEGFELGCWFCPQCIASRQLPPSGTVIVDEETFLTQSDGLYRPICPGCFQEWQARGLA
jgi:hypothetical protein